MTVESPAKGVVAAGHALTAQAGADILREGGNAFDAAIAALAMACLCEPVLASPGGGGFAMARLGGNRPVLIDFFPQTPMARQREGSDGTQRIYADFGTATQAFHIGHATAATPGFLPGLAALYRHGATLPLSDLFVPVCSAARAGIRVSPFQSFLFTVVRPILTASDRASALFAPGGCLLATGDTFRNPGLAEVFESFADEFRLPDSVSRAILADQNRGGHLTPLDLENYRVEAREPTTIRIGGARAHLNPPPAASGQLVAHSLAGMEASSPLGMARAMAKTDRMRLAERGGRISTVPVRQKGTTHISVIDGDRNACSVTVSNGEGNGYTVGRFGFMLNNILGEEDVNPGLAQAWPEDRRLASMMCPALVEAPDGGLLALGSGGSNRIRSALFLVLARHYVRGEKLAEAIAAPRMHLEDGHLDFEAQFSPEDIAALCEAFPDHRAWPEPNLFFGGVHAAEVSGPGRFSGAGDARREGIAIIAA